jgi:hypothetical protein
MHGNPHEFSVSESFEAKVDGDPKRFQFQFQFRVKDTPRI